MKKEFVPYEQALELKELGFDEPCFATWVGETLDMSLQHKSDGYFTQAPTFSQVFRWFRYNFWFYIEIQPFSFIQNIECSSFSCVVWHLKAQYNIGIYKTYEEAELACLKKLIELAKKNNYGKI